MTHLDLSFCFDTGHANIMEGVEDAFDMHEGRASAPRTSTTTTARRTSICSRSSRKAAPSIGSKSMRLLASRPEQYPLLLELKEAPGDGKSARIREADLRAAGSADRRRSRPMSDPPRIRIADAGKHVGEEVADRRLALQPAQIRQDRLPSVARRLRHHAVCRREERTCRKRCSKH